MSRRSTHPQSRHHIILYDEDWKWLEESYGDGGTVMSPGIWVKELVHRAVLRAKAQQQEALDAKQQGEQRI